VDENRVLTGPGHQPFHDLNPTNSIVMPIRAEIIYDSKTTNCELP